MRAKQPDPRSWEAPIVQSCVLGAIQRSSEDFMVQVMKTASMLARHRVKDSKKKDQATITDADLQLALDIRGDNNKDHAPKAGVKYVPGYSLFSLP